MRRRAGSVRGNAQGVPYRDQSLLAGVRVLPLE